MSLTPEMLQKLLAVTPLAESGNNPTARSPYSSASGLFQITDPMWDGLRQNYPNAGLTDKNDPDQQRKAYTLFAQNEVQPAFTRAGLNPTETDFNQAWAFGTPTAIKMAQADPSAPVSSVLGDNANIVVKNNPAFFPKGLGTTVGEARQATGSFYSGGQAQTPDASQAGQVPSPPNLQGGSSVTIPADTSEDIPDAPKEAPLTNPDGAENPVQNVLTYLAAWGSGANGQDFAAGLGAGAGAGLKALQDRQSQALALKQHNQELDRQDWQDKLTTQKAKTERLSALAQRGNFMAEALKSGVPATSLMALFSDKGGTVDTSGIPSPMRAGSGVEAPQWLYADRPDGRHMISVTTSKADGTPHIIDATTGETLSRIPTDARDPTYSDMKYQNEANVKNEDTWNSKAMELNDMATKAMQVKSLLPRLSAGTDFAARFGRAYTAATGMPFNGKDAEAAQYANQLFGQIRNSIISGLHGRTDLPIVRNIMASSPSLENSDPAVLSAVMDEAINQANYNRTAMNAWDNASDTERSRGIASFMRRYQNNPETAYKPTDFDKSVSSYRAANQPVQAPSQGPLPTSQVPGSARAYGSQAPSQGTFKNIGFRVIH